MTDKEMNMAILDQLYNIALGVWSLMEKHVSGSFTAREVQKRIGPELFWGENDMTQRHEVAVGTFRCEFPTDQIFSIVARFEAVAGIGSKRRMFTAEEKGETIGSVTFQVHKGMAELCNFVGDKHCPQPALHYIFIDTVRICLVATDGRKLKVQRTNILHREGDTTEMFINAQDFKKMCAKMKAHTTYEVTATKEHIYLDKATKMEFCGILSSVKTDYLFPKWSCVFDKRAKELHLPFMDWREVYQFAKAQKVGAIIFSGTSGNRHITIKADGVKKAVRLRSGVVEFSFQVILARDLVLLANITENMDWYLSKSATDMIQGVGDDGTLYGFMPCRVKDDPDAVFVGEHFGDELMMPRVTEDIDLLNLYAPVVESSEPEAQAAPATSAKKKANKPAKKTVKADVSRKFTFEAVGVKHGDKLTFVDGTEVWAIDGTKVAYMGKEYTLSGFCKAFMPDEKRNKANSYRGCAFFYKDGVKLEKLFKDVLKAREAKPEAVEPVAVETLSETNDIQEPAADVDGQKEMNPNVGSPATAECAMAFAGRRIVVRRMLVADYLRSVVPVRRKPSLRTRKAVLLRMRRYVPDRGDRLVMARAEHHGWPGGVHTYPLPPPL